MASDPAVIPDGNRFGILNILPTAAHIGLVRRSKNGHIGTDHDAIADGHDGAVQDGQVEVCVEALANADVAAVVDREGWVDTDLLVADVTENLAQELEPGLVDIVWVGYIGEVVVVVHGPFSGLETACHEAGLEAVVPASVSLSLKDLPCLSRYSQHARHHLLVLISTRHMGKCLRLGDLLLVLLGGSHDDPDDSLLYGRAE